MNTYKIGQRVSFLDSKGTGIIESFRNEKIVIIRLEEGVSVPHNKSNLVPYREIEDYNVKNINTYDEQDRKKIPSLNSKNQKRNNVSVFRNVEMVVDLHIEDLIDNHSKLSNGQILNIQLAHFNREFNLALKSKIKKLIVIHGVGEGVLKSSIRKEMYENYPKYEFKDASYRDYGYGATEIILR